MSVVDLYHQMRADCGDQNDRRMVWRMFALALLTELQLRPRPLGAHRIDIRRASGDENLPQPFRGYWSNLHEDDLAALWIALERARHRN